MKAMIEERKQEMRNYNNNGNYRDNGYNQQSEDLPSPPQRPSFCSDEAITQYVFDGCTIQVFIARNSHSFFRITKSTLEDSTQEIS